MIYGMNEHIERGGINTLTGLARSLNRSAAPELVRQLQARRRAMGLVEIPGAIGNPAIPFRISKRTYPEPEPYRPPLRPAVIKARAAERAAEFQALKRKAGRLVPALQELLRKSRREGRRLRGIPW